MIPISYVGDVNNIKLQNKYFDTAKHKCIALFNMSNGKKAILVESRSDPKYYKLISSGITNCVFPTYEEAMSYCNRKFRK